MRAFGMLLTTFFVELILAVAGFTYFMQPAEANKVYLPPIVVHSHTKNVVDISDNLGGIIEDFLEAKKEYEKKHTLVRFHNDCASACTLFLGLDPDQICLYEGATFTFHSPYVPKGNPNHLSENDVNRARLLVYMIYPQWVKDWLDQNHALTFKHEHLTVMDYNYAKEFIQPCKK